MRTHHQLVVAAAAVLGDAAGKAEIAVAVAVVNGAVVAAVLVAVAVAVFVEVAEAVVISSSDQRAEAVALRHLYRHARNGCRPHKCPYTESHSGTGTCMPAWVRRRALP